MRAAFDDNSFLRDRMSYELWNRIAGPQRIRIQTFSVAVYLNGMYHGLFTVTDHIDEYVMAENGLSPGGDIFKSVGPDANFYPHPRLSDVYEKTNGAPAEGQPGAFDPLVELTNFVNQADDQTFRSQIGNRIQLSDYRAWLITSIATQADDTMGKNAYHYFDPTGGPWRVVPWDWNNSWGQNWMTEREAPVEDPGAQVGQNHLFQRLWTDDVLGPETRAQFRAAITEQAGAEEMLAAFDRLVRDVASGAHRDERLWRGSYVSFDFWAKRTDFTDFDGEAAYVRKWIMDRWAYLAGKLDTAH